LDNRDKADRFWCRPYIKPRRNAVLADTKAQLPNIRAYLKTARPDAQTD